MGDDPEDASYRPSPTVPLDSIPTPVAGYDVEEGEPMIVEVNVSYEAAFDTDPIGISVRRWLREEVGVTDHRIDDVCSSLADGRPVDVEFEAGSANDAASGGDRYRLRTFDGAGDASTTEGYVLVTERPSGGAGSVDTDRIASVISHDLRNPLDVANAHLRAARETGDDEHFDQVRRSHDRMEQIIQDVLTLARGKSALSIATDVDIEAVAADAWATVDTKEASITLEDDLPTTAADPDRLQRLFENLFRNSIEHAHPTAGETADPTDSDGQSDDTEHPLQVRVGSTNGGFFVADNGTGVPVEDRTRVFDPGYSSNETGNGTGLGLTIVEQIADAHDWTVSLTTGSMGGARFEFRPLSEERPPDEGGDPSPEEGGEP